GNPLRPVRRTGTPALRSAGGHAHAIPHRYPAADLLRAAGLAPTVRTGAPGHHGYGPRSDAPWPAPTEISAKGGVGWITPKAYPRVFVRRAEIRDPRYRMQAEKDAWKTLRGFPPYDNLRICSEGTTHDRPHPSPLRSLPCRRSQSQRRGVGR